VEHKVLISGAQGFDKKWINWMRMTLTTESSSILLNGVPGSNSFAKRGVRQGDPLSSLLFVCGRELLQSVINDFVLQGILKLPMITNDPDFPVVQYADGTS
jgi:hypothetical protein